MGRWPVRFATRWGESVGRAKSLVFVEGFRVIHWRIAELFPRVGGVEDAVQHRLRAATGLPPLQAREHLTPRADAHFESFVELICSQVVDGVLG